MVVELYGGQRRHIYLIFVQVVDGFGEPGVKGVDAFDDHYVMGQQLEVLAAGHTLSGDEVVARQLHLLALEQLLQLLGQEGQVEGLDSLVVIVALLISRCLCTRHEIIIQRNGHRLISAGHQLHTESLAECGLTARRRACHEHHLDGPLGYYVLCHVAYLSLLECLPDVNHIVGISLGTYLVEVTDGAHSSQFLQSMVGVEDLEHLLLLYGRLELVGHRGVGQPQQQSVIIILQAIQFDISGGGAECSVIVVGVSVEGIVCGVEAPCAPKQLDLACHACPLIHGYHLVSGLALLHERQILGYKFVHLLAHVCGVH